MNVEKLYAQAKQEYDAENFDKAMKLVDKIKKAAPKYYDAYLLESRIWDKCYNYVKTYNAL